MAEKKSRMLYIKHYLEEYSDELHPVTVSDIQGHLKTENIEASRQTVVRELEQLAESGEDLVCNAGNPNKYFIGDRYFELPELKLLVDAVQASCFIPQSKTVALINKLSGFASRHQACELRRSLYTDKMNRPADKRAYITVDLLHTAVNTERKITCKYFDWDAEKNKVYKHRTDYRFSPYGLMWNNDRYYAVGWSDSHDKIITLRVDRIAAPKLTDEPAAPRPQDFDITFYADKAIQMYDGIVRDVTLLCKNGMMRHIIDRFGENVNTKVLDTEHFSVYIKVPTSPTFFAWVFTFGGDIQITAPEDIVTEYRTMAKAVLL